MNRKSKYKCKSLTYTCIVSLVLFFGYSLGFSEGEINFWLDYCTFKQSEAVSNLVELYYAVPFNNLAFIKTNDKFGTEFQLELSIYDEKDKLVINKEWTQGFLVNTLAETRSSKEFIGEAVLEFSPGAYRLVASISDLISSRKTQVNKELVIEEFGKNPLELSSLKLSKQVNSSIVPNPRLVFEDDLYLSYEIYFGPQDTIESVDTIELDYSIYEVNEQDINISRHTKIKLDEILKVEEKFALFDLLDGQYMLKVNARFDTLNASKEREFSVKKPTYNYSLGDNFSENLRLLRYVATKKELKEFNKLKLKTADEITSYLERFWKQRDPTPQTSRNELFEAFSRRVRLAIENFSSLKKKGWQTDRGHVYIVLGQPYVIRDLPFEIGQKPRQVWTYGRYGDLIFEDEWHTGDYRLVEGWDRLPRKFTYR